MTEKRYAKGFTLFELVIVMLIIVLLILIIIPRLTGYIDRSRDMQYVSDGRNLIVAAQSAADEKYSKTGSRNFNLIDRFDYIAELADLKGKVRIRSLEYDRKTIRITDMVAMDGDRFIHYSSDGGLKYDKFEILKSNDGKIAAMFSLDSVMRSQQMLQHAGNGNQNAIMKTLHDDFDIGNQVFVSTELDKQAKEYFNAAGISIRDASVVSVNNDSRLLYDLERGDIVNVTQYMYVLVNDEYVLYAQRDVSAVVEKRQGGSGTIMVPDKENSSGTWNIVLPDLLIR